jgi:D-alanyl-D-alanine carboxypeptidase/D-alanyl-D-alanine-endopeptidase (penicillin-binding protein 4)
MLKLRKVLGYFVPLAIATLAVVLLLGYGGSFRPGVPVRAATPPTAIVAQVPSGVTDAIAKITAKPNYTHSTWGYAVADLGTGKVLLSQASDKMFVTGSILKTYSTTTALANYGPGYRFRTPVYRLGDIKGGVLNGNLVLVASGDFSFGLREQKDGTLAFNSSPDIDHNYADTGLPGPVILKNSDPLAALNALAKQVRAAGIRQVQGDVVIDDRLFQTFNGWPDGVIAPIWVNENVLDITVTPPASGQQVAIDWRPKTAAYTVKAGNIKVVPKGGETQLQSQLISPGVVQVSGQIAAESGPLLQIWQIPTPANFARTAFIEALERAGVKVNASVTSANPSKLLPSNAYPEGQKVAEHVSPPLSEFTKAILKVSYNRGADLMVCLVAVKNGSRECLAGIAPEVKTITDLGVSKDSTFIFDGAGSDERDRTSPTDMTKFLRAVSQQPYEKAFRYGLPILGVDGTLATNQKGTPAAGKVQAKTGSRVQGTPDDRGLITGLTQVGYIEAKSGRQLVFATMVRDVPIASTEDIFAVDNDEGAIEAAVQQRF